MDRLLHWEIKKNIIITKVFQEILNEYDGEPNKVCAEKDWELYYSLMKSWFQNNDTEIHSPHHEGKSFVAEWFINDYEMLILINQIIE